MSGADPRDPAGSAGQPGGSWDLDALQVACAGCRAPFPRAFDYHSALVLRDGRLAREDYCIPCWSASPVQALSHWGGRCPAPPEMPSWITPQRALEVLSALERNPDAAHARGLLALLLVRRKVLRLEAIEPGPTPSEERLRLLHPRTGERVQVVSPRLQRETLGDAKEQLTALLFQEQAPASAPAAQPPGPGPA